MQSRLTAALLCFVAGMAGFSPLRAGGKVQTDYRGYPIKSQSKCVLPYDDQTKAIICTNRSIPPNWVIVGVRHTPGCNGLANNSWVIQRLPNYPGADLVICACQPIPPGWAVVEEVKDCYCGKGIHGVRIRKM
ncbi:hypothetical protein SH661x_001867 [Planctomicrobium sp. SH661]|uniref:hypothetical protein n=1 Tax=Planctomicrobium sp. SH661 TaxID=3448124 RepID=UPI003F5BFEA5